MISLWRQQDATRNARSKWLLVARPMGNATWDQRELQELTTNVGNFNDYYPADCKRGVYSQRRLRG